MSNKWTYGPILNQGNISLWYLLTNVRLSFHSNDVSEDINHTPGKAMNRVSWPTQTL